MLKALSTFIPSQRVFANPRRLWKFGIGASSLCNGKHSGLVREIVRISEELKSKSNEHLASSVARLKSHATNQSVLRSLLPEAYGIVREAARRVHNQSHYDVQIVAGIELFHGNIAEMQTGEGKTLAALLPAFLFSLVGKGCHVVTANDYLAQRDANFARAAFQLLGVTVGCLHVNLPRNKRKAEYGKSISYGTAREFGFDFLKDLLSGNGDQAVQREHFFALVDEADSVMIDDARTPLLIASAGEEDQLKVAMISECQRISQRLTHSIEFTLDRDRRASTLSKLGCLTVLKLCEPEYIHAFGSNEIYRQVENSISANNLFHPDRHYVVTNGVVSIVDESTGRIADGRKWQSGLHQAVEAKARVAITAETKTMAKVTVQTFFRRYQHLAGLTGTAQQVAREFNKVYGLSVKSISTRKPSRRKGCPDRIFQRYEDKARAIAIETIYRIFAGQAVLIGTPSVQASQRISQVLNEFEIEHDVLNCLEHGNESRIIEYAGRAGRVTVATNMAGRGTDIHVDEQVLLNGGLHIIASAKHSSSRIDRQLIGRTGRQGLPGSFQFFLSLEDEVFSIAGEKTTTNTNYNNSELSSKWSRVFEGAQSKIERLHAKQRFQLLKHEKHRNKLCFQIGLNPCLEMLDV